MTGSAEKEADGVRQFAETIKGLNKQTPQFWSKYAGKTIYVHFSDEPEVLYDDKDFRLVVAYAEKNPHDGATIVPVPSNYQIKQLAKQKEVHL